MTIDPTSSSSAAAMTNAAANATSSIANTNTFLQLLVAQIKNQDPLNPTDGTQFVSQLAQFSQLEQVIGIRGDVKTIAGTMSAAGAMLANNAASPANNPTPAK